MRLIPEYEPVQKLYLCFVHEFFNTRFQYSKAICEIIQAAQAYVEIEVWIGSTEMPYFEAERRQSSVSQEHVIINHDTPGRAIIAKYMPIFARDKNGEAVGLVFQNPFLNCSHDETRRTVSIFLFSNLRRAM